MIRALVREAHALLDAKKPPKDKAALGLATATEDGVTFATGVPVTFKFMRYTLGKTANFGSTYGQDIEPAGRYVLHHEGPVHLSPDKYEAGVLTFKNPLVLALAGDPKEIYGATGWKARLQAYYGAKKRALSKKIMADGHDGIVTVSGGGTSEIVDLTSFK